LYKSHKSRKWIIIYRLFKYII